MNIYKLKANENNPRYMSVESKKKLQKTLEKFGDLGCIVFNRRTKRLIGGHQRVDTLGFDSEEIVITQRYKKPTRTNTVAEGYVVSNGEKFKYREVDAPEKWEREALLAANKHSGEWDVEKLRENFDDFPDLNLDFTGFSVAELGDLGIEMVDFGDLPGKITDEINIPGETDEQYLRKNKGSESYAGKERIPNTMLKTLPNEDITPAPIKDIDPDSINPFDDSKGKDSDNARHVIVIECVSPGAKKDLRKKLEPLIQEAKAKII